jgi:hypothetical protein
LGEKALPFYALIKQGEKCERNEEAEKGFEHLKPAISAPPVLVAPREKRTLTAIHHSHTTGGQHCPYRITGRRRKDPWCPTPSIFPQRSFVSIQAAIPTLSEAGIWSLYVREKTKTLLFGTPDRGSQ